MRLLSARLIVSLALCASTFLSHAATVVAVKTGIWVSPDTWSCKCLPKRTDSIIIPQSIIVSVMQPLMLGPSEDGKPLVITVAGVLNLSSGSVYMDPVDRIIVLPGGKVSTRSFGGMIYSGIYAQYLEGGTIVRGPATLGDGFSPSAISAITADKNDDGVTLSWRSGSEIEVNFYYVLRSADGITFDTIGKVDGRGSRKQKLFSFVDEGHPAGVVHYRIDLTNTNGVGATVATVDVNMQTTDSAVGVVAGESPRHR